MRDRGGADAARQAAKVVGALLSLAGLLFVATLSAEPIADERGATLIDPAGYAFVI
jgi:hypothetical protein